MRATASIENGDLILLPSNPGDRAEILTGIESSGEEVRAALPWFEWEAALGPQVDEYLAEVHRLGSCGLSHHLVIREGDAFCGLVALDHTPHLIRGHWNLGYWVVREHQGRGLAGRAIDGVLEWIGRGGLTAVEIRVDPENAAGRATAASICRRWAGHRLPEGDGFVEVDGEAVHHECWLVPRLPPEAGG